ncbi:MAG: MarR family transcriptional regulator [Acidobacteriaceae bacterium]|nr:MarR family transcriptional regulator [Acidobacteriaceae bacterium]
MRIENFLTESPMFCVIRSARHFDSLATQLFKADGLNFLEALILSALFFESAELVKPSQLAEAFSTTRSSVSHCISALESRGLVQRKVDPTDARAYHIALRPQGRKAAIRVIGALDRLQKHFEDQVGKDSLQSSLNILRTLTTPV